MSAAGLADDQRESFTFTESANTTYPPELIEGPAGHQREKCPTCERPLPQKDKGEEAKVRKGWTIAVPVSELEDGAETLDTLLDECRKLFGHDDVKKVRFYTLSQALALVVQNGHRLAADA